MPIASNDLRRSRIFQHPDAKEPVMIEKGKGGEGNREADRRYRKGVKETVENTSKEERGKKARNMSREDLDKARQAEEKGKSRARK
jgi:IMP dehydrogenase/GMP reductase